jgi:hypothetical protein
VPEVPEEPAEVDELSALIARAEKDLSLLRTGGYEHTSELVSDLLGALRSEHEQRDLWKADAERYAANADYWRGRVEAAPVSPTGDTP